MPVLRVPAIALLLSLAACSSTAPAASCSALFGRPVAATGLTDTQCSPGCACGGTTRSYLLDTYASEAAARAAGASPTHFGHCGVWSSLENLAVYMKENDLSAPVRDCGATGTGQAPLKVTPIRTGPYLTAPSNPRAASCPMITSANPPTSRWKSEGFNVWVMPDQTRRPVETS